MSKLFSPIKLRDLEFKNRIFMAPMCQYSVGNKDGVPIDWHRVHYGTRAVGGAALVMVEATAVAPEGRISPYDLGIWSEKQAEAFGPITRFIREQGAIPAIQLAHAGRKASTDHPLKRYKPLSPQEGGWLPLGPSPVPFAPDHATPKEMTKSDMDRMVDQFSEGAGRALKAGFEVAEIHMAHGYLLHEFLSPLSNQRKDQYGGSLENRLRLPLKVAQAVREVWPNHLPVFVRISATDWVEGGWDLGQSLELAKELKKLGIDLVDCSSGGTAMDAKIPVGPGYHVPFAAAIKKEASIPTGAVGLITEPGQAEGILQKDEADVILLGRELLRNPYWPLQAARSLQSEISWPFQYERAKPFPG